MKYCIFLNEDSVLEYNNEVLKRYVGNKLVKIISNPSDDQLVEFGYKPLFEENIPNYDVKREYLEAYYIEQIDKIIKSYKGHNDCIISIRKIILEV